MGIYSSKKLVSFATYIGSIFLSGTLLVGAFSYAHAATAPRTLGYQGYLAQSGTPLEGTANFTFSIYNASSGGSALWSETQSGVAVSGGYFSVSLGSQTSLPASLDFSEGYYLAVTVNSTPLSPRQSLDAVPYAHVAYGFQQTTSAPSNPSDGSAYFDSTGAGTLYVYDSTSGWSALATSTPGGAITNLATNVTGTLAAGNGGTGISSVVPNQVLIGNGSGGFSQIATSSLGFLTTNVAEGSNLYFTNSRADARADGRIAVATSLPSLTSLPGLSFTGIIDANSHRIIGVSAPTSGSDAATKDYVDSLSQGLSWQAPVISLGSSTPPISPASGDRYVVGTGATGVWAGHDSTIATWNGSSWTFITPSQGYSLFVTSANQQYTFNGSSWVSIGSGINLSVTTGTLGVTRGGTGLVSGPSFGQLLVGDGAGGYTLTGTSSLGFLTTNVAEGSNLYFTNARARGAISNSALGLSYDSASGLLSIAGGYVIPTIASTTAWNNGISQWQTSGSNISYVRGSVGIGTTTPSFALDVAGVARATIYDKGGAIYNVKAFGALGDGVTDDTAAIQAAIEATRTAGFGTVYFPGGTYISGTLTIYTETNLEGDGVESAIIKLKNGTNADLIKSSGFDSLTGTDSAGGIGEWSISNLTLDGNKASNTSGSGLRVYGFDYSIAHVNIRYFAGDGMYSEWSSIGTCPNGLSLTALNCMEANVTDLNVNHSGGNGINFRGPHDSQMNQITTWYNGQAGVYVGANAGGLQISDSHSWGGTQKYAYNLASSSVFMTNTQAEGATITQVQVNAPKTQILGGIIYLCSGGASGITFGTPSQSVSRVSVDTRMETCNLNFVNDAGNSKIKVLADLSAGPIASGTPNATDQLEIKAVGGSTGSLYTFPDIVSIGGTSFGSSTLTLRPGSAAIGLAIKAATTSISSYVTVQDINSKGIFNISSLGTVNVGATTSNTAFVSLAVQGNALFAGNVTATGTITGASLSVGSLSGILRATAGVVSAGLANLASDVSGVLGIANGGTGTSTAPTYGQVLVGDGSGGYTLMATSSLGIIGGGGTTAVSGGGTGTTTQSINGVTFYDGTKITSGTGLVFTGNNLGIGTATPQTALDVAGTFGTYGAVTIGATNQAGAIGFRSGNGTVNGFVGFNGATAATEFRLSNTTTNGLVTLSTINNAASGGIRFLTANTERGRFDYLGNFGVGTSTPVAKVDIYGTTTTSDLFAISSSSNARLFTVTGAGNVGIGTSSPFAKLTVAGDIGVTGRYYDSSGNAGTLGQLLSSTGTGTAFVSTSSLGFASSTSVGSANQVAYYNSSGVLGGTSGFAFDGTNLSVGGTITAIGQHIGIGGTGSSATPSYTFTGDLTTGIFHPANNNVALSTGGVERLRVDANGNVGIGSTTPGAKLALAGGNFLQSAVSTPTIAGSVSITSATNGIGTYVQGHYAYSVDSGGGFKLSVIDITNPSAPVVVGTLSDVINLSGAFTIKVAGQYAYITATASNKFAVVDVSNPSAPVLVAALSNAAFTGARGLYLSGRYAYVVNSNSGTGAFTVVDISSPTNPVIVSSVTSAGTLDGADSVYVSGIYAYATSITNNRLVIYNISNPANPSVVGSYTSVANIGNPKEVWVAGRYAYVLGQNTNSLAVIDVSNPASPTLAGVVSDSTSLSNPKNLFIAGHYAYVTANGNNRITVIDISNPAAPLVVSSLSDSTNLSNIRGIFVSGKYAYVSAGSKFTVVDINGIDVPSANLGVANTETLSVFANGDIGNDLYVRNGIIVGSGGIQSGGALSVFGTPGVNPFTVASSSGATLLTLTGAGNLGIGTSTPFAKLTVGGDLSLSGGIYDNSATRGIAGQILQTTGTGIQWISTSTLGFSTSTLALDTQYFKQNGNAFGGLATLGTKDSNALRFITNNAEVGRFDTTGNFGIGSSSPSEKLVVAGAIFADNSNSTLGFSVIGSNTVNSITAGGIKGTDTLVVGTTTNGSNARGIAGTGNINGGTGGALTAQGINGFATLGPLILGNVTTTGTGGGARNRYTVTNSLSGYNVASMSALSGSVITNGTNASTTDAVVFNAETPSISAGNLVTNAYGFLARGGAVTGTLTNRYGVYIENLQGGTNRYGIYQAGATDNNYFAGNVGIGSTTPFAKLTVTGDIALTGGLYDSTLTLGTAGQILQTTGTGIQWISTSTLGLGSGTVSTSTALTSGQVNFSTGANTIGNDSNFLWDNTAKTLSLRSSATGNLKGVALSVGGSPAYVYAASSTVVINSLANNQSALKLIYPGTPTAPVFSIEDTSGNVQFSITPGSPVQFGSGVYSSFYDISTASNAQFFKPIGSTIDYQFVSNSSGNQPLVVSFTNNGISIGNAVSSSHLTLPAGGTVASSSPLKFTSGSLMTTPENGAVEYDGTHAYITISGARKQLDQQTPTGTTGQLPYFSATNTLTATSSIFLSATGNLGIGTTTPDALLHVAGTGMALDVGTGVNVTTYIGVAGNRAQVGYDGANAFLKGGLARGVGLFVNGNANSSLIIDTSGNVGIGTTTPNAKLQITGTAGTSDIFAVASSSNARLLTVTSAGNVGIGTSTPTAQFHTTGTVRFSNFGAGTLQTDAQGNVTVSSDERLKNVNGNYDRGLADIQKLSPILYHWNTISGLDQTTQYAGFSAQNVQSAIPEAVTVDNRGYLALQDRPILAASINAIKELAGQTVALSISTSTLGTQFATLSQQFASTSAAAALPKALTATEISAQSLAIAQGVSAGSLTTHSVNADGTVSAARYIVPATAQVFTAASTTMMAVLPAEALTEDGTNVDVYKLASYAVASVQALASRTDLLAIRIDDVEARVGALEAARNATSTVSQDAQGVIGLAASSIQNIFESFGIFIRQGIAQFTTLVTHQLVFSSDTNGTSSAASVVIPQGQTEFKVVNTLILPTSKIFITFTSSVNGSWYISKKEKGSFTVSLASAQSSDVTFDYFLVQTEGQIAAVAAPLGDAPAAPGTGTSGTVGAPADGSNTTPAPAPISQDGGPIVSLNGEAGVQLPQGAAWTDPGATAVAADGTNLTSSIAVSGGVDTNTPGLYTVTYRATDAAGKYGEASRIVTVLGAPTGPSSPAVTAAPIDSGSGASAGVGASDPAPSAAAPDPTPAS